METVNAERSREQEFKTCSKCGWNWASRKDFLGDPTIELVGYQPHFEDHQLGFFLFTHTQCGTTLNIPVEFLRDLYGGPVVTHREVPPETAQSYCIHAGSGGSCPASCECLAIMELSRIIREWEVLPMKTRHL